MKKIMLFVGLLLCSVVWGQPPTLEEVKSKYIERTKSFLLNPESFKLISVSINSDNSILGYSDEDERAIIRTIHELQTVDVVDTIPTIQMGLYQYNKSLYDSLNNLISYILEYDTFHFIYYDSASMNRWILELKKYVDKFGSELQTKHYVSGDIGEFGNMLATRRYLGVVSGGTVYLPNNYYGIYMSLKYIRDLFHDGDLFYIPKYHKRYSKGLKKKEYYHYHRIKQAKARIIADLINSCMEKSSGSVDTNIYNRILSKDTIWEIRTRVVDVNFMNYPIRYQHIQTLRLMLQKKGIELTIRFYATNKYGGTIQSFTRFKLNKSDFEHIETKHEWDVSSWNRGNLEIRKDDATVFKSNNNSNGYSKGYYVSSDLDRQLKIMKKCLR